MRENYNYKIVIAIMMTTSRYELFIYTTLKRVWKMLAIALSLTEHLQFLQTVLIDIHQETADVYTLLLCCE